MQNKKISRIFEIIIWAFVIDIVVTIPFAVISLAYAPYFHKFIIPISNNKLKDKIFANLLSKTKKTSYAACWQYVTGDGFGFSVALLG